MSDSLQAYLAPAIFDGERILEAHALLVESGNFRGIVPAGDIPANADVEKIDQGTLAPGYVDIQVNGGGGIMFNDNQSAEALATIAAAHASLGATSILPTLITDTAERIRAAIDAVEQAIAQGIPGIAGLHLEGPHLSPKRKGAHAEPLIRSMADADLKLLMQAAQRLPVLMVTISPESVSSAQIQTLSSAGVILSLGHTTANYSDCVAAVDNGVSCVTHLFNAMSQLGSREPGVVGAALSLGNLSAGLIADTHHVHAQTISTALRAKRGPGQLFLVSDAMATAGSDIDHFILNGRRIERHDGRLTLEDGTLAGADLDLTTAVRNMTDIVGTPLPAALAMATSIPARIIGKERKIGHISKDNRADFILLDDHIQLARVWQNGALIPR
jgi:N-acetylglucosamine-6-phosphate deacetylase